MDTDPRWYDGFFEGDWLDCLAFKTPPEETVRQVDFLVARTGLEPGARVLDVPCGHGRHSLELARRGFRVVGVDLSPRSLELARRAAEAETLELDLVRADMRELAYQAEFDAALNLFSSFGYFEHERDDVRVLRGIARALRPGGAFLIDVVSPLGLARRYQQRRWEELDDGGVMLSAQDWDLLAGRTGAVWTFVRADGSRSELRHSLRTYAPWELASLLEGAGLGVVEAWGDYEGAPFTHESWRLILLARKRE